MLGGGLFFFFLSSPQPFNEIPLGFCFSLGRSLESQAVVFCIYLSSSKDLLHPQKWQTFN